MDKKQPTRVPHVVRHHGHNSWCLVWTDYSANLNIRQTAARWHSRAAFRWNHIPASSSDRICLLGGGFRYTDSQTLFYNGHWPFCRRSSQKFAFSISVIRIRWSFVLWAMLHHFFDLSGGLLRRASTFMGYVYRYRRFKARLLWLLRWRQFRWLFRTPLYALLSNCAASVKEAHVSPVFDNSLYGSSSRWGNRIYIDRDKASTASSAA